MSSGPYRLNRVRRLDIRSRATIVAAVVLAVMIIAYGWYRLELRPVSGSTANQNFTVAVGDHPTTVAANLASAHLIRSRAAFLIYAAFHGLRGHLQVGIYALSPSFGSTRIANLIASGKVAVKLLTIPEGKTAAQIAQLVSDVGLSPQAFAAALGDRYVSPVINYLTPGAGLEGFLFPDTYQVAPGSTAHQLIQQMLSTFISQVPADFTAAWVRVGLSNFQAVTLASVVQREVSNPADQAMVAQVFLNRLRTGMKLESDVTAQYAAALAGVPFSTTINSPYNTYVVSGLPAGPICSPGLSALRAVAHPTPHNYYYFFAGRDGKTYYAQTFTEHQRNIRLHS